MSPRAPPVRQKERIRMDEARLSLLPFWGPSEAINYELNVRWVDQMKRSPRSTQGFIRTLNPKLERFIRFNPTDV